MPTCRRLTLFAIAFALAQVSLASAQEKSILVASTTSTEDSGLFRFILPVFKQKTGIDVRVVARGTGQQGRYDDAVQSFRAADKIMMSGIDEYNTQLPT